VQNQLFGRVVLQIAAGGTGSAEDAEDGLDGDGRPESQHVGVLVAGSDGGGDMGVVGGQEGAGVDGGVGDGAARGVGRGLDVGEEEA